MKAISRVNLRMFLVGVALLLEVARLALPFFLAGYVNERLETLRGFDGSVGAIRVNLLKGAYTAYELRLSKTGGKIPVPFLAAEKIELALGWRELLRGNLRGQSHSTSRD